MIQTLSQSLITIGVIVFGTVLTRFLPFLIFPPSKPTPKYIQYLGRVLASAVIGLLIVYCLKGVSFTAAPHGLPEAICVAAIVLLHWWRRNILLSIAAGTLLYMLLVQFVFPL